MALMTQLLIAGNNVEHKYYYMAVVWFVFCLLVCVFLFLFCVFVVVVFLLREDKN